MAALEILEQVRKQQLDDLLSALRQDQILNSEQYQSLEQQSRDVDAHDPEFAALEWLASQRLRAGGDKLIDERWLTLWWARRRGVELIYLSPSTVDLTLTAQHLSQHYCQLYKLLLVHLSADSCNPRLRRATTRSAIAAPGSALCARSSSTRRARLPMARLFPLELFDPAQL